MALKKEIKLPNGFKTEYHTIEKPVIDAKTQSATVRVVSYENQARYNVNNPPRRIKNYIIPEGTLTVQYINGRELIVVCYDYLKTLSDFEDAIDV